MKKSISIKVTFVIFFLIVVLNSLSIIFDRIALRFIFEPLINPLLMVIYLVATHKIDSLYIIALFFALIGDIFMLNGSNEFFIFGLGFFLLMCLAYMIIATRNIYIDKSRSLFLILLFFLVILMIVILLTSDNINELLWPIVVYGVVVCLFATLSFYLYLEKKSNVSLLLFLGSFLFIISNSMTAIERFRLQNKGFSLSIMVTYAMAQFLICRYMIKKSEIT